MTLRNFLIRRLLMLIPTFLIITFVVFSIIYLAPGNPIDVMFAGKPSPPSQELIEQIKDKMGLDEPVPVQYLIWLSNVIRGDLGYSYFSQESVANMIAVRIPRTLELMVVTEVVAMTLAIVLGVIAAFKEHSLADVASSLMAVVGYATPSFWVALMALMVFSLWLGWFPGPGISTPGVTFATPIEAFLDHLGHLILPVLVLAFGWTAYLFRIVRSSMLEVLKQDYILTARAKGLKERVVIYKHALRNVLLPVVTYVGLTLRYLLGGAVVIEQIFGWLGLGNLTVYVAANRDYPTLMGLCLVFGVMIILGNLCADVGYAIVDPRIRYD